MSGTQVLGQPRQGQRVRPPNRRQVIAVGVAAAVMVAVVAVALVARSGQDEPASVAVPPTAATPSTAVPSTAAPAPAAPATVAAPAGPTAATHLAAFLAEAQAAHERLQVAADAVNGSFHENEIVIEQSTAAKVDATWPEAAREAIPAGLDPAVLRATLLVYSELVSRSAGMSCFGGADSWSFPRVFGNDEIWRDQPFGACLRYDPAIVARLPADLAALRDLAARTPMPAVAAPDSRAAADLAVHTHVIELRNAGCEGNGGYLATELGTITWRNAREADPSGTVLTDGDLDGLTFQADYLPGTGWRVRAHAC